MQKCEMSWFISAFRSDQKQIVNRKLQKENLVTKRCFSWRLLLVAKFRKRLKRRVLVVHSDPHADSVNDSLARLMKKTTAIFKPDSAAYSLVTTATPYKLLFELVGFVARFDPFRQHELASPKMGHDLVPCSWPAYM